MLALTVLFMNGASLSIEVMARTMGYENRLFDNSRVHTVDIVMDDWDEFIDNTTSEEYYTAAMVIDGEAYKNVGIRGKGNTSLSNVASMGSERYSFKVEFDHYDSSITYHGLDKLSLNNLIQDSTMMKDYLTYTMMNEFGAAAPLCSFVYITVNGEDWGLYLAVEGIEDSFLTRNYGSDHGELYKPDSMSFGGGRGNGKDFNMDDFMNRGESADSSEQGITRPDGQSFDFSSMFGGNMPDMGNFDPSQIPGDFGGGMPDMDSFDPSQMQGTIPQMPGITQEESDSESGNKSSFGGGFNFGGMGGFGMGSSDVKLQYIDDEPSSYSNIWSNAKTDITEKDQTRLIESLKKLSSGEELESVVDIEAVIRYFVVHNYVCNGDSYTGSMIHNYYLYEENGQLAMLPWDYNLAFGTFQGGNGQSTVNTPIDSPVSEGSGEDRPMWSWILSDDSYTELYHKYFAEFLNTVDVQAIIDNAYNLIKPYVYKDPTAFYTYEEFEVGVETLKQFCDLRSESISMQLANGETVNNMNYADGSALTLSDMGSMGGKGGFGGNMPSRETNQGGVGGDMPSREVNQGSVGGDIPSREANQGSVGGDMPSREVTQGGVGGDMPSREVTQGNPGDRVSSGSVPEIPDTSSGATPTTNVNNRPESVSQGKPQSGETPTTSSKTEQSRFPGGNWGSTTAGGVNTSSRNSGWLWVAASVSILAAGLFVAKLYRY